MPRGAPPLGAVQKDSRARRRTRSGRVWGVCYSGEVGRRAPAMGVWLAGWLALLGGCVSARVGAQARLVETVPYATAPLPARAKIFLVAGGVEVANFAAEVVAQRRLWLARGYAADEIACYWAHPGPAELRADRDQYMALADELRACYPASTALLRDHLQQASRADLPFLYLYVTSHGDANITPVDVPEDRLLPTERALFDQYVIQLGAGVGRGVVPGALALALRRGADPDDLVLSPRVLRDLLLAFPARTPKLVVLQACHSGGFLDEVRPERRADAIAGVPRVTAIASARFDRTSFGCDAGADMTYFGEVYTRLLTRRLVGDPTAIDWPALFFALRVEIAALERSVEVVPSLPMLLVTP